MRLINCVTYRVELSDQHGRPYWILSHTWGGEEVTFQDMQDLALAKRKRGFGKIQATCRLALQHGISHVWIDTCCIDKSSSAELTESINSMFYWYQRAERCIAFLEDLAPGTHTASEAELRPCRWFTRGWTLQELIAPRDVEFYDGGWNPRGTKRELIEVLRAITNIGRSVLRDPSSLHAVSVARRMSWAANRQTSRIEDKAYCLLGIFDVNLPLIYGERTKAFIRLQQAIALSSNDMSLFAWLGDQNGPYYTDEYSGLFSQDPSQFSVCTRVTPVDDRLLPAVSWAFTNAGIEMTTALDCVTNSRHMVILRPQHPEGNETRITAVDRREPLLYRLPLYCTYSYEAGWDVPMLAVWLRKTRTGFLRYRPQELCLVHPLTMTFDDPSTLRLAATPTHQQRADIQTLFGTGSASPTVSNGLRMHYDIAVPDLRPTISYHPAHLWDQNNLCFFGWARNNFTNDHFTIGLVEIQIPTASPDHPSGSVQTCWVFCGLKNVGWLGWVGRSLGQPGLPWVCVALEGRDENVLVLGKIVCHRRDLLNPFVLSIILSRIQHEGCPNFASLPKACVIECTPTRRIKLSASAEHNQDDGENTVTVRFSPFDPAEDAAQPGVGSGADDDGAVMSLPSRG